MIHKVYRSKNGHPFACVLSVGRATEEWEAVTCPDCLAHKVPPVSPRLDYILSSLRRAVEIGYPWSVSPSEAAALVAEVERLRGEAELLRTGREVARSYADRVEAEVLSLRGERAAVVAWLRACEDESCVFADTIALAFAAEIERGEHRREETE